MNIRVTEEAVEAAARTSTTGRADHPGYREDTVRRVLTAGAPYMEVGPAPAVQSLAKLASIMETISRSGVPDEPFFYLGGPMTGIPQFNFPRFHAVADRLRSELGFNIVSPAELDDPETEKAALASPDGAPGSGSANGQKWEDFLSRDLVICALPTCQGGIFMEGWHRSSGANLESYVLNRLKKSVREYSDELGEIELTEIDRDSRITELNDIDDARKAINEYDRRTARDPFWDRP